MISFYTRYIQYSGCLMFALYSQIVNRKIAMHVCQPFCAHGCTAWLTEIAAPKTLDMYSIVLQAGVYIIQPIQSTYMHVCLSISIYLTSWIYLCKTKLFKKKRYLHTYVHNHQFYMQTFWYKNT